MFPSPKELDAQCTVQLDGWVDLNSERWREVDADPALTKKWIKMGMDNDPPFLGVDSLGRIWGKGTNGTYYPYYLEYGKKKLGIRISIKAAN